MVIILGLIELYVYLFLSCVFLDLVIISGGKGIDIHNTAMCKYLVINKRRETLTTESESYVTSRGCVKKSSLGRIDTLEELMRLTLLFKVDQIFVILVNLNISEGAPSILNLFSCNCVL